MKALVVYDSVYGNTESIAKAIETGIASETQVAKVNQVDPAGIGHVDLLVVGSPTLGGRPTEAIQSLLSRLPDASVKGVKVGVLRHQVRRPVRQSVRFRCGQDSGEPHIERRGPDPACRAVLCHWQERPPERRGARKSFGLGQESAAVDDFTEGLAIAVPRQISCLATCGAASPWPQALAL